MLPLMQGKPICCQGKGTAWEFPNYYPGIRIAGIKRVIVRARLAGAIIARSLKKSADARA